MSATLRHNIGVQIALAIDDERDVLKEFGSKQVGVYAGTGKPDWQAVGFAIKLPAQIAEGGFAPQWGFETKFAETKRKWSGQPSRLARLPSRLTVRSPFMSETL